MVVKYPKEETPLTIMMQWLISTKRGRWKMKWRQLITILRSWFLKKKCQSVKKKWKQIVQNIDKKELFRNIEKYENHIPLKDYDIQKQDHIKQFACAVVYMQGESKTFDSVYPEHKKKNPTLQFTLHSEEILIEQINNFLYENENFKRVERIHIFTLYSPCLLREDNRECCMFKLLDKAYAWGKYGISTLVVFRNFWGLAGPDYFDSIDWSTFFDVYREEFKDVPFKFDSKDSKKPKGIFSSISETQQENRIRLKSDIELANNSLQTQLKKLPRTYDKHIQTITECISNLSFSDLQDTIRGNFHKTYTEMVTNHAIACIKERKTEEVTMKAVEMFKGLLGPSSPLHLVHLSEDEMNKKENICFKENINNKLKREMEKKMRLRL